MSIYEFKVKETNGEEVSLAKYKGKVLLIVNTASKCGLTPQYEALEMLYKKLGSEKFEILAFPCNQFMNQEPEGDEAIKSFCSLSYNVTFPIFSKIDVNGKDAAPLYKYLKSEQGGILGEGIKWNFTKFLVDTNGEVVERVSPVTPPEKLEEKIRKLIAKA